MATRQEAAEHIFLSPSQFDRLRREGALPEHRGKSGYDLEQVRRAYIEHLRSRSSTKVAKFPDKGVTPPSVDEQIKAQKLSRLQREEALERRQIAPVSVLQDYAERVALQVRSALEALPGALQKRIPHLRAAEVNMIRAEVTKIGDRIADFDAEGAA